MIVQVLLLGFGIALALWDLRLQVIATSEREFCRRKDCRILVTVVENSVYIVCPDYLHRTRLGNIVRDSELLGIQGVAEAGNGRIVPQ